MACRKYLTVIWVINTTWTTWRQNLTRSLSYNTDIKIQSCARYIKIKLHIPNITETCCDYRVCVTGCGLTPHRSTQYKHFRKLLSHIVVICIYSLYTEPCIKIWPATTDDWQQCLHVRRTNKQTHDTYIIPLCQSKILFIALKNNQWNFMHKDFIFQRNNFIKAVCQITPEYCSVY